MTGAAAGDWTGGVPVLRLYVCRSCRAHRYLPRERCAACGSPGADPVAAAGTGRCVAVTTLPAVGDPLILVLVELDEGPTAMGRAASDVYPGASVHVEFRPLGADGELLPYFARQE